MAIHQDISYFTIFGTTNLLFNAERKMSNEGICLVEIVIVKFSKGTEEFSQHLKEFDLFDVSLGEAVEDIPEVKEAQKELERLTKEAKEKYGNGTYLIKVPRGAYDPDVILLRDLTGFKFNTIGQSFDEDYSNGLDYIYRKEGAESVFNGYCGNYLDELKILGQQIIDGKKSQGLGIDGNVVRFITVWAYRSWQYSYYGEWDEEWELLGLLDLKRVKEVVTNEQITIT